MTSANGKLVGDDMTAAAFWLPSRVSGTTVTKFGRRKEADKVGSWKLG